MEGALGHGFGAVVDNLVPGTHEYYIQDDCEGEDRSTRAAGTIQIPPKLVLPDGQSISPDQVSLQTLVSKWMGPMSKWDPHILAARDAGYNMIHFTPLQRRGLSNSPYSIYDHLELAPELVQDSAAGRAVDPALLEEKLRAKIDWMYNSGVLAMTDVVWNHTSCDSPWLAEHPEAGYTLANSPHLQIAYELDECIMKFSGELKMHHLSPTIHSEADVQAIMGVFAQQVLPREALWEYFVIDVGRALGDLEAVFRREAAASPTVTTEASVAAARVQDLGEAERIIGGGHARNSHQMDTALVSEYYRPMIEEYRALPNERDRSLLLSRALAEYRQKLDQLNYPKYQAYDDKVQQIQRNLTTRIVYERVAEHGPKLGPVSRERPLVSTYFTRVGGHAFANNGWIWNADPLVNFAEPPSDAYFTREIIVWGDCVKLRYGEGPADSPWLWDYMTQYTERMARLFHGFRIDNCHSTPLHVASHLLSRARAIRPQLYVCAELFTGSEERDMLFVRELGLNSLIRESMAAWDPAELGRITRRYGGKSIDSTANLREHWYGDAHALLMDCTHDNETPAQKRTAEDALPNAAIAAICTAAIGSTRGYDELTPKHLNIVTESRPYPKPDTTTGLWSVRGRLNQLHQQIVEEDLCSINVYQDGDLLMVERTNPRTLQGLVLLARTAFHKSTAEVIYSPIGFTGYQLEFILAASLTIMGGADPQSACIPITPAAVELVERTEGESSSSSSPVPNLVNLRTNGTGTIVEVENFAPGSILVLRKTPLQEIPPGLSGVTAFQDARELIRGLNWSELNVLLYRCAAEENEGSRQIGTYNLPDHGPLAYSGLQGFHTIISRLLHREAEGPHALITNVKGGDWALEYLVSRLEGRGERLEQLARGLREVIQLISQLPCEVKPRFFVEIVTGLYDAAVQESVSRMSSRIQDGSSMIKSLAMASVQLVGCAASTGLYPTSKGGDADCCLSAGLPHFSTHHMRCWGRDVFISLSGLLLQTGRAEDARRHLLAFASCYYRGLLPNLLDSARRPRYNARDATFWFLGALQDYCRMVPNSDILEEAVPMRFPSDVYVDFDDPTIFGRTRKMKEIVHDILQAHAQGIQFREWNAGPALDPVMTDAGFNMEIRLDPQTGFVHGGNGHNCGTWMDKMGESERAGNRGVPATPRDGAAIEIQALLGKTLQWLVEENPTGMQHVLLDGGRRTLPFAEWYERLRENFERHFYIPETPDEDAHHTIDASLVLHRGIYKDTVGASHRRGDYQLRPNMIVAMATCPALFTPHRAVRALAEAEAYLVGPLGMKTLSPLDPDYRPNYDNANDSTDASVARGFNYHQGPQWVWPFGCYLQACQRFLFPTMKLPTEHLRRTLLERIKTHWVQIRDSDFAGLVELTNEDGAPCRDSCATQAWSMATLLEALLILPW